MTENAVNTTHKFLLRGCPLQIYYMQCNFIFSLWQHIYSLHSLGPITMSISTRHTSDISFLIKSRPFDVTRHQTGLLYAKFRNGVMLLSVFILNKKFSFGLLQEYKKQKVGINIVHCMNTRLLENIETCLKTFYIWDVFYEA